MLSCIRWTGRVFPLKENRGILYPPLYCGTVSGLSECTFKEGKRANICRKWCTSPVVVKRYPAGRLCSREQIVHHVDSSFSLFYICRTKHNIQSVKCVSFQQLCRWLKQHHSRRLQACCFKFLGNGWNDIGKGWRFLSLMSVNVSDPVIQTSHTKVR